MPIRANSFLWYPWLLALTAQLLQAKFEPRAPQESRPALKDLLRYLIQEVGPVMREIDFDEKNRWLYRSAEALFGLSAVEQIGPSGRFCDKKLSQTKLTRPTKVVFWETTLKKHGDFEPEFLKNRLLSGASKLPIANCQLPIFEEDSKRFSNLLVICNWQLVIGNWQCLICPERGHFFGAGSRKKRRFLTALCRATRRQIRENPKASCLHFSFVSHLQN